MPQELLRFPAAYVIVGAYRLVHDESLWRPIWAECSSALRTGAIVASAVGAVSLPFIRLYVQWVMKSSALIAFSEDARLLGVSLKTFATISILSSQVSMIIEWFAARKLRKARADAYEATVRSRHKSTSFWGPYVEEWAVPPVERAQKRLQKKAWYAKLAGPWVRMLVLKVLLQPLHFIPFLGLVVGAFLRSLSLGEMLHQPYFVAKRMTPYEQSLFMTENEISYRIFGFTCALLERTPIFGLLFSVSNRIGAAMMAFDLEKRQQQYRSGELKPTQRYESRTAKIVQDVPDGAPGSFPRKAPASGEEASPATRAEVRAAAAGASDVELPGSSGVSISEPPGVKRRVPPPPAERRTPT